MILKREFVKEKSKKSVRFIAVFLAILTLIMTMQMSRITSSAEGNGSSETLADTYYNTYKNANNGQAVKEQYKVNDTENLSDDGLVRVRKSVIPTDSDNEFLVYLSIDEKQEITQTVYEEYFTSYATYGGTTSNSYHKNKIGDVVNSIVGGSITVSTSPLGSGNSGKFIVRDHNNKIISENVTLYWSKAENTTFYMKVDDSHYVLLAVRVNTSGTNNALEIKLTQEIETLIKTKIEENITQVAKLNSVIDTMGEYIQYYESFGIKGNYKTGTGFSNGVLTWIPDIKSGVNPKTETTTSGNKTITTKWYCDVAELVYRVKLDVTNEDFVKGFDENKEYLVNKSAVLTYEGGTATFPQPTVKGKLKSTNVTVIKNVEGVGADKNKSFDFSYKSEKGDNSSSTFSLSDGDSKTISGMYVGDKLKLTETENEDYDVSITANGSTYSNNGEILITEDMEITVTNTRKTANVTVVKNVDGDIDKASFPFTYAYSTDNTSGNGSIEVAKGGSESFEVPTGATVTLTENPDEAYEIENVKLGLETTLTANAEGSYEFKVNSDVTVTVTNKPVIVIKDTTVTVKKYVTGNMGDKEKEFEFTAVITSENETPVSKTFKLKHNGEYKLTVPIGATLVITEKSYEDYETTSKFGSTTGDSKITIDSVQAEGTVEFTNKNEVIINTGINLDSVPYVISIIGVISLLAFMLIKRRRCSEN